jgi:hypothetical protein
VLSEKSVIDERFDTMAEASSVMVILALLSPHF